MNATGTFVHRRHVLLPGSQHMSLLTDAAHARRVAQLLGELIAEVAAAPDRPGP